MRHTIYCIFNTTSTDYTLFIQTMHSKTSTFVKLFIIVSGIGLLAYTFIGLYSFYTPVDLSIKYMKQNNKELVSTVKENPNQDEMKYILQWVVPNSLIIDVASKGRKPFFDYNCKYKNCYMTTNKLLNNGDYRNFEVIIIDFSTAKVWKKSMLPIMRSPKQIYVFRAETSSDDEVICNALADNYFNWTWTYRLSSEIFNPFFEVTDLAGRRVAPDRNVVWPDISSYDRYLNIDVREKIGVKQKAVAWVMNSCYTKNMRILYARELQSVMKSFDLQLDIYGCDYIKCFDHCNELILRDYYFYLAYEESMAEDYLTQEVLKGYNNYAVPIVISGADLTRFLPTSSYINGHNCSTDMLAALIDFYIKHPDLYYNFHLWRNHYNFHPLDTSHGICQLCDHLNNASYKETHRSYQKFRKWWYPGSLKSKCAPKSLEKFSEILSYVNDSSKEISTKSATKIYKDFE